MYDRMVKEHGYSIRRLAQKLGKDKGYLENRLRLAGAPPEIQALVSVRKDTISHAYELLKVEDPKKRRRLAEQVAAGELTLVKLRERVEGRRRPRRAVEVEPPEEAVEQEDAEAEVAEAPTRSPAQVAADTDVAWTGIARAQPSANLGDDALVNAKQQLADSVDELVGDPSGAGCHRVDRVDRSGESRQVPDHRQASSRECDRLGPERRRTSEARLWPLTTASARAADDSQVGLDPLTDPGQSRPAAAKPSVQPAARMPRPIALASQPRSRRAARVGSGETDARAESTPHRRSSRSRPAGRPRRSRAIPTAPTATMPSSPAAIARARRRTEPDRRASRPRPIGRGPRRRAR